ncbi:unnamed protein product (macronuclear) [Paramecium tetraurelia]|uniref:Uncharacterized protein n=1 Tax=Paramecium tetraurelia TaxID=5888 RepID=A0DJJ0_PARTE|nr:uncharacterized protein GSPATT00017551001 [Paramecium tetraurelia]CAK83207.1 unnamed protein product [Paramecium tetraurelia]|eukprot:XP_001450604.1 hypothetical protein (macronuclear) [Paramecium tetraurelia strain d4-2]
MKSQYEKLFPNFKPPSKLDSDIILKAKQYIQQRQKKMCLMPRKACNESKYTLLSPKQTIHIPSIITVSLSNQLQYQRPLKSYEKSRVSTARSKKSVPKLDIKSLNFGKAKMFFEQKLELRSQNNSKNDFSLISPWSNR